jgi:hypothetical protein
MSHVDDLSRLHADTICALSMPDLLNEDIGLSEESRIEVVEELTSSPETTLAPPISEGGGGVLDDAVLVALRALGEVGEPFAPGAHVGTSVLVAADGVATRSFRRRRTSCGGAVDVVRGLLPPGPGTFRGGAETYTVDSSDDCVPGQ